MARSWLAVVLAAIALLVAFFAAWLSLADRHPPVEVDSRDGREPNVAAPVDRVKDAAERARMEAYAEALQASKRVVRTFQSPSGEAIDCVDIYAQPALKRQGMEGHQVMLAPSGLPSASEDNLPARGEAVPDQLFMLTGETCPDKTAPMARLTMETLKRFRTLDDFLRKEAGLQRPMGGRSSDPLHEYAHASRAVANWGGESVFNVYSPFVEQENEFSLSQMWITRGSGADLETVEGGWQVYHDLYGDWRAHLFIYFTPDNYGRNSPDKKTTLGCYNTSCNGFVQVSNTIYVGGAFTNYSVRGGQQYTFKLLWYKDGTRGDWWLRYGDTWVGYYPRSLFDSKGLSDAGDEVDFGGEIVNDQTDGRHTRTDMGSGRWPYESFGWSAYQRRIRYVDTSNFYRRATNLTRSVDNDRCYDLSQGTSSGDWEEYFYFGGSGFNRDCP